MKLTVIGLNHHTAPLAIREQLAFAADALPEAVRDLSVNAAAEAVILSTCNRTELYCVGEADMIINWLANYQGVNADDIRPYLYTLGCSETIRHAFRVACGLDSMVLGEAQILGQMKEAVRIAREQGSISTWLNALFQRTFQAAKEVRSLSGVGDNVVSMASAAVRMAEQSVGDISNLNVLFVGAGEMNESVATYFAAKQPRSLMIANRTLTRAVNLCSKLGNGAQACKLEALPENLPPLPATCERYYQRLDQCFAQQGEDAEALRASNQDLRVELARSNPSENECAALNRSFDTLAPTLGCR